MIDIRALGPLEVTVDGEAPPRELLWRKNLGLLLYLSRSRNGRRPRESITTMFWGDKPEADARHSLNEALRVVRKSLPDEALTSNGDLLFLEDGVVSLDVTEFAARLAEEALVDAAALVRGRFAEGFSVPDSNGFEDWLSAERSHWGRLATECLVALADDRLEVGDVLGAREVAWRAEAIDPLAAAPTRLLIQSDAVAGDPTAALARYHEFATRLEQQLGLAPPADLEALAARIRSQRTVADPDVRTEDAGLSRRLPLVGRGPQLKQGMQSLRRGARQSSPSLLVVSGPAGAGKTRLAEELISRAQLDGFRLAAVRCDSVDRDTPFGALRALTDHTELFCDEPAWSNPDAFAGALAAEAKRGPVLVWIDDVQFLDASSWKAIGPMMRDLPDRPITLLLTGNDAPPIPELDDVVRRLGRDLPGEALHLEPLTEGDLADLARRALPDWEEEAIDRLARRLKRDTAGIPMLAVDLLHALRLGFRLEEEEQRPWPEPSRTLDDPFPKELPDPLVAAIRVGFRRLSPEAQELLQIASVADGRVTVDLFVGATGREREAVLDTLDELEWRRWLSAEPRGYDFVAGLHREIVLNDLMTKGQRNRLRERLTSA